MKYFKFAFLAFLVSSVFPSFSQEIVDSNELIDDLNYLASDELLGRGNGSEGNEMARIFIAERFKTLALKPQSNDYFQSFSFRTRSDKDKEGVNVIGTIQGKTDKIIIITAHYDHLGKKGDKIYNGADDNASGVAGIMAIARYYSINPPNNTLVFVAFDAEEMGLQGARHFVKSLPYDKDEILLNINLDMVGRDDNNRIFASGASHYPQLLPILEKVKKNAPVKLMMGNDQPSDGQNDWTLSSDHGPFHQQGIPFIYFGVEDHADYHKHTDTADKIKPAFFQSTVTTILQTVNEVDQNLK